MENINPSEISKKKKKKSTFWTVLNFVWISVTHDLLDKSIGSQVEPHWYIISSCIVLNSHQGLTKG